MFQFLILFLFFHDFAFSLPPCTLSLCCNPLRLDPISHRNGPFPLLCHPHKVHISALSAYLSEPPLVSLSSFSPRSAPTSLQTLPPLPLQSLPPLSVSFFLQSKIHGIYFLPHFLGAALGSLRLYPRMFLLLPLSQLPFFSFPLERLLAFLAYLSSERSTSLFCYTKYPLYIIYILGLQID